VSVFKEELSQDLKSSRQSSETLQKHLRDTGHYPGYKPSENQPSIDGFNGDL